MEPLIAPQDPEHRFRVLFDEVYLDLLRFVRRRVDPTHAEDVVGEVMLVAWRRLDDVPLDLAAARPWLCGVAHRTLLNARRSQGRQAALAVRLAAVADRPHQALRDEVTDAELRVALAWPRLGPTHQEALALAVLDGLTAPEAAVVLGISPTAFRLRLSRARRALRRELEPSYAAPRPADDPAPFRRPR